MFGMPRLEDTDHRTGTLVHAKSQATFLADVRKAARSLGVDLVLNARIDTYRHSGPDPFRDAVRRANLYADAGADCVYPILLSDEAAIAEFVARSGCPVNVLADLGAPVARLATLGVARISVGPRLYQAARTHLVSLVGTTD
jgi:2-methylisocitrate lyase-like PEP mutase family enzyme